MAVKYKNPAGSQLRLLDVEGAGLGSTGASCCSLAPGQQIVYVGRIRSRLRYGERGIVRKALRNRAVVDMGAAGTWHLPYYLLQEPIRHG